MKLVFIPLFAGIACTFVQPTFGADATTYKEKIVYSFCSQQNCTDGAGPDGGVIAVNGLLYGTTSGGGSSTQCNGGGCGTVFSVDPATGAETVLYSFCPKRNCNDGAYPVAGLLAVNGILYGTTAGGGQYGGTACPFGCGAVFSLDPSTGAETVLYSFCHDKDICADGATPQAGLIDVNGVLYGTTYGGGGTGCNMYGCGTVFGIDPSTGTETMLYSFCSQTNCADGETPQAALLSVKGKLYGTTLYGGPNAGCDIGSACGTVFTIDLKTGAESVAYAFCSQNGCADGALPNANLINVKGTLYGTTSFGGVYPCQNRPPGCGAVFSLDPGTGGETVLHSFGSGDDGIHPSTGLVDVKGTLYGTTYPGGSQNAGAAFALDLSTGTETVIWSFCGTNCDYPSSLIDLNGKLYGTLAGGGRHGGGAVFELKKTRQLRLGRKK